MFAGVPRGVRVLTAGAPPAAATIERIEVEVRLELNPVLRAHRRPPHSFTVWRSPARTCVPCRAFERAKIKARQGSRAHYGGKLRVVDEFPVPKCLPTVHGAARSSSAIVTSCMQGSPTLHRQSGGDRRGPCVERWLRDSRAVDRTQPPIAPTHVNTWEIRTGLKDVTNRRLAKHQPPSIDTAWKATTSCVTLPSRGRNPPSV